MDIAGVSREQKYRENKNGTRARKKTPWKWKNLQKMNVCQILIEI